MKMVLIPILATWYEKAVVGSLTVVEPGGRQFVETRYLEILGLSWGPVYAAHNITLFV